ncbi:MAG: hypothetical protein ACOC9H_02035 [Gemmatimonadota bacterium]
MSPEEGDRVMLVRGKDEDLGTVVLVEEQLGGGVWTRIRWDAEHPWWFRPARLPRWIHVHRLEPHPVADGCWFAFD